MAITSVKATVIATLPRRFSVQFDFILFTIDGFTFTPLFAQGKTLSMKLVRAGRAMNAGVYFVTQNTDDLLDEKLKNNLGLKFAFRSTDLNEIKKTLAFFGVDPEDENNQKRLRDLENGQCLISDLYGRVGVIQFHPVFEELLHAFDTRPPVRKDLGRGQEERQNESVKTRYARFRYAALCRS